MRENTTDYQTLIDKANIAIDEAKKIAQKDGHRLGYHVMAPANWLNDPNGLIHYKGEYHLFYQHHPFSPEWGPMHWGHVKSKDLVHWEHLPIALAPSEEYDEGGCFSGSAVDDNGTLTLIYTGHVDGKSPKEVQCIATSSDGITFVKHPNNPVISAPPADSSEDFRDPKVWKHEEHWYMVVGSGKDGRGKALLYKSADLTNWEYLGPVLESDGSKGEIWECPDLFPLDGKYVFICSPIEMEGAKTIYFIGDMNYQTGKFTHEYCEKRDYGFDFYAPQTFLDDQGRRILIGWMDMWGAVMPTQKNGWAGAMTIPRELSIGEDGKLRMKPVKELTHLREKHWRFDRITIHPSSANILKRLQGDCLELIAEFELSASDATEFGIKLRRSANGNEETVVGYQVQKQQLYVDRTKSGVGVTGVSQGKMECLEGILKLHIFLDRSSIEVFSNDGQLVMSNRIYPDPNSLGVEVFSNGGPVQIKSLDVWKLKSIW